MKNCKFTGKCVMVLWVAVAVLGLTSPAARAAGTITITKAVMVEKDAPNAEVTSGYADADLSVDFRGDATCSCACNPTLTFTWHFGDGTSAQGKNVSHVYGTSGAGNRAPYLHVSCTCGATADSGSLSVSAIDDIRVDRIGDIANPTNNGRLCFNNELRVAGTALPVGVSGSSKIDWHISVVAVNIDRANTASGSLPSLAEADWPWSNAGWGSGTLYISIDGPHVPGQQNELRLTGTPSFVYNDKSVKKFFEEEGTQNPGAGNPPNWFHYWRQTSANSGTMVYDANKQWGWCDWDAPNYTAYIGREVNEEYTTPSVGANANTNLEGIDFFAWDARHEWQHHLNDVAWWGAGGWNGAVDTDGDQIPNTDGTEGGFGAAQGGPYNVAQQDSHPADGLAMDGERYTVYVQPVWSVGSADPEDWARPGHQWP